GDRAQAEGERRLAVSARTAGGLAKPRYAPGWRLPRRWSKAAGIQAPHHSAREWALWGSANIGGRTLRAAPPLARRSAQPPRAAAPPPLPPVREVLPSPLPGSNVRPVNRGRRSVAAI